MRRYGAHHRYRVQVVDTVSGVTSPGPDEMCDLDALVIVEFPNLLSFVLLVLGVLVFAALVVLILVLIFKTRKIDLEIRRLQKVAEMHELTHIDSHWSPAEETARANTPLSPGGAPRDQLLVKAIDSFEGAIPLCVSHARDLTTTCTRDRCGSG